MAQEPKDTHRMTLRLEKRLNRASVFFARS
jgi:hypothetical protein